MLMQASSGLERLMAGNQNGVLKDSTVAQISAYLYYNAHVISKLTENKQFQNKFSQTIFEQIDKDFGEYIDAKARTSPRSLHHVYEWKKVGNKSGRLFQLALMSQDGLSFKISTSFKPSRSLVPLAGGTKRRHTFINKASVMEAGMPLKISPKNASRLVFDFNGETVFMPKGASVLVKRPGGPGVKNQYFLAHSRFFTGQLVNQSIKRSGFQRIFNAGMAKALNIPSNIKKVQYRFNPNLIRSQADASLQSAFGGAL
jgi:hypothetical protein